MPAGLRPAGNATLAQLKWSQSEVLPQLRALGVKIAIDGFGSDYSSCDYIKEYRVNHLKIARSYINESAIDSAYAAAMRAIFTFAQELGIAVTDSATQAQGFHFSKAVSAECRQAHLRRVDPCCDIPIGSGSVSVDLARGTLTVTQVPMPGTEAMLIS
jgi:predicted signal transduction protein with EAL and GGDEF domain